MNIYTLLRRLPYTLIITSLALAAAVPAESVELKVLTPDDFDQTIAKGVWFIEHFSPYCGHCRRFAPTWTQLVEETEKQQDPGIHLAQVNCAVNGDLCNKNGVTGYPQLNLYKDGEFVEQFKQSRDLDILQKYLADHAEPTSPPPPPLAQTTEVARAADAPPPAPVIPAKVYNPSGLVTVLNEKNFAEMTEEGHVFIKYYAPWCGHCKKLAPTWVQLAAEMRDKLTIAEVDCEAHGSICRSQGVNGYPMLYYYGGGESGKTEYTGGRRLEQLRNFAEKVSGPAVQELKYQDLQAETAAHDVIYLLVHPSSDGHSLNEITKASQVLFGSPPVYYSSAASFYEHFGIHSSQSMVLAFKDHDYSSPAAVYTISQHSKQNDLTDWLLRNRLPTAMELDADSFQEVMNAAHKPFVVIVATPPEQFPQVSENVKSIAKHYKDNKYPGDVVFTWMDSDKWGSWLKSMYGIKAENTPQIVVVKHSRLIYYDVDQYGEKIKLTQPSIVSAINGAIAGTIPYKHSENIIERIARYLNNKLVVLEHVVEHHPWRVTFFVVACLVALIVWLRRIFNAESVLADEMNRKARLD